MLNAADLTNLSPYLSEGKVVNIEVKDRGRKGRRFCWSTRTGGNWWAT